MVAEWLKFTRSRLAGPAGATRDSASRSGLLGRRPWSRSTWRGSTCDRKCAGSNRWLRSSVKQSLRGSAGASARKGCCLPRRGRFGDVQPTVGAEAGPATVDAARSDLDGRKAFIELLKSVSLRLVRSDVPAPSEGARPHRFGSGLLTWRGQEVRLHTCTHLLRFGTWQVELHTEHGPAESEAAARAIPIDERRTPLVALGEPAILDELDYAVCTFEPRSVKVADGREPALGNLNLYRGPFVSPVPEELYGFIAWNRPALLPGLNVEEREATFELGMTYVGHDKRGLLRFRLEGRHKGDRFYEGASGCPIADTSGAIVGLLSGREANSDNLLGVPLAALTSC